MLNVVASESYKDFVAGLRGRSWKPSVASAAATVEYFTGKTLSTEHGTAEVTAAMAKQIYRYLVKNDYTDDSDQILDTYREAKAEEPGRPAGRLNAARAAGFSSSRAFSVTRNSPGVDDGRKPDQSPQCQV